MAERYCDIVSFNIYGDADNLTAHARHVMDLKKPGIIGSSSFAAMDRDVRPQCRIPGRPCRDYIGYIQRALDLNWCVGASLVHLLRPALVRFDGENSNIGFVSQTDTPHLRADRGCPPGELHDG